MQHGGGGIHSVLELLRILSHHLLALLEGHAHRVVTTHVGVVEGGLIGTEVHEELLLIGESLPDIDDVTEVTNRDADLLYRMSLHGHRHTFSGLLDGGNELIEVGDLVGDPALVVALVQGGFIDLLDDVREEHILQQ